MTVGERDGKKGDKRTGNGMRPPPAGRMTTVRAVTHVPSVPLYRRGEVSRKSATGKSFQNPKC